MNSKGDYCPPIAASWISPVLDNSSLLDGGRVFRAANINRGFVQILVEEWRLEVRRYFIEGIGVWSGDDRSELLADRFG